MSDDELHELDELERRRGVRGGRRQWDLPPRITKLMIACLACVPPVVALILAHCVGEL